MNLYGILGQYLPAFGRIVGQMQHDLFHVYTVDEHILMVIRNLRRFTEAQHAHEYPLCSRLIGDFERKEVLYLAGLFHDIAKGRGGDHSTLGARDAERFCRAHGLTDEDAELVGWLVEQHLMMSSTAQKQDISDPAVIEAFAAKVGTERRLTALYLLTVADIRGTSPRVWNAWKAQLLEDLFHATRRVLAGDGATRTLQDSLQQRQEEARRLLRLYAVPEDAERALWRHLDTPYFLRHSAEEIAWHARHLYWRVDQAAHRRQGAPVAVGRRHPGARLPARPEGTVRAHLRLLRPRRAVDPRGQDPHDARTAMRSTPSPSTIRRTPTRRIARRCSSSSTNWTALLKDAVPVEPPADGPDEPAAQAFPLSPEIRIFPDDKGTHYILEVVAGDRPGLLARIAYRAGEGQRQCRERENQHARRAGGGRVPDRRRAVARRGGAAAAGDGALRAAQSLEASALACRG